MKLNEGTKSSSTKSTLPHAWGIPKGIPILILQAITSQQNKAHIPLQTEHIKLTRACLSTFQYGPSPPHVNIKTSSVVPLHPQSINISIADNSANHYSALPLVQMDINMDNNNLNINNTAIDLSTRSGTPTTSNHAPLVRPIPRFPWTIPCSSWYQSAWPNCYARDTTVGDVSSERFRHGHTIQEVVEEDRTFPKTRSETISPGQLEDFSTGTTSEECHQRQRDAIGGCSEKITEVNPSLLAAVLDVACCDGPVVFEKVSNPNFALTVEHGESTNVVGECQNRNIERRQLALKTYLCIYCNQSFKSLFCYQKHKKRHLNPVSVDITATHTNAQSRVHSENKTKTKDLNVQFFPCKKCGSKFPSYYFVHKHRKVCHAFETA